MKPEEKVEIILFNWLRPFVDEIYFNRKNFISAPIFKTKGNNRQIPDLIIKTKQGFYLAVEVKPYRPSKLVKQGHTQLLERYWKDYCLNKTDYYIDDKIIYIDKFLLATDNSLQGYLFNKETIIDNIENCNEHIKMCIEKYKIIPRYEGNRTKDSVRIMWDSLREYRKSNELLRLAGLGIIINDYENQIPYLFVVSKSKSRWGQHYWRI